MRETCRPCRPWTGEEHSTLQEVGLPPTWPVCDYAANLMDSDDSTRTIVAFSTHTKASSSPDVVCHDSLLPSTELLQPSSRILVPEYPIAGANKKKCITNRPATGEKPTWRSRAHKLDHASHIYFTSFPFPAPRAALCVDCGWGGENPRTA